MLWTEFWNNQNGKCTLISILNTFNIFCSKNFNMPKQIFLEVIYALVSAHLSVRKLLLVTNLEIYLHYQAVFSVSIQYSLRRSSRKCYFWIAIKMFSEIHFALVFMQRRTNARYIRMIRHPVLAKLTNKLSMSRKWLWPWQLHVKWK